MNRIEFLNSLTSVLINNEQKKQLSAVYNFEIPEIILKILSKYPLPVLYNKKRTRIIKQAIIGVCTTSLMRLFLTKQIRLKTCF